MTLTPAPPTDAPASPGGDRTAGAWWAGAGALVGVTGLAVAQFVAELSSVRTTPMVAVVSAITGVRPGSFAQATVEFLAGVLTPAMLGLLVVSVAVLFSVGGLLWRRSPWASLPLWGGLTAASLGVSFAVNGVGLAQSLPAVAGLLVWIVALAAVAPGLRRHDAEVLRLAREPGLVPTGSAGEDGPPARRAVLRGFVGLAVTALAAGAGALGVERRRAAVDESRRLLRIPGVTRPQVPLGAETGLPGITPWQTSNDDFQVLGTGLRPPAVEAAQWRLRIHGMVDNPVELTYSDLLDRELVESWISVASVEDEVGGESVGNAWWSGVPTSVLLAAAGVRAQADTVLQTGADGRWTATSLRALTAPGQAMLAVAMNGQALPLEHGFPVRTVVPGLYSESSDCRWVVEWEVTTGRSLRRRGLELPYGTELPVRLASRVDVPESGATVDAGAIDIGGVAWHPGTGIERVQYSLDGSEWRDAVVAHSDLAPVGAWSAGTEGAWAQWTGRIRVGEGDHDLRVRAINRRGEVQSGVRRDPMPSGASGWHEVTFSAQSSST